jgi:hypothetical protein
MENGESMSTGMAVVSCLFAASLWGSWAASLKYIGTYPLEGFVWTLYTSSFCFVWIVGIAVKQGRLFSEINGLWERDPWRLLGVVAGGAAFALGMALSLTVMRSLGLSVAQPIQSSVSMILGTVWTVSIGGLPDGVKISRIILAISILICAVLFTMLAAWFRALGHRANESADANRPPEKPIIRYLPIVLGASLLSSAYPWALALGLHSKTQDKGISTLPYMALLVTGAFISVSVLCSIRLTRSGQLRMALSAPLHIKRWGIGSGIFHFGGNIIHSLGAAALSASIAYPLGLSASFWTQLWGLGHGEFRGTPRGAKLSLAIGMTMYCTGVGVIVSTL